MKRIATEHVWKCSAGINPKRIANVRKSTQFLRRFAALVRTDYCDIMPPISTDPSRRVHPMSAVRQFTQALVTQLRKSSNELSIELVLSFSKALRTKAQLRLLGWVAGGLHAQKIACSVQLTSELAQVPLADSSRGKWGSSAPRS